MISAQNTSLPFLGSDIRPDRPDPAVGPEALTARIAMEAANLREVVAESRSRNLATLLFLAAFTAGIDLNQFEKEADNV